jgi:uroporphyrinogen-III synthase
VPRGGAWGERVAGELSRRGAHPVIAPLIRTAPPRDTTARDAAFGGLPTAITSGCS